MAGSAADTHRFQRRVIQFARARRLLYILGVRERTDKLVRELVLDDPAPFVPLVMKKRGKETDYEAKTVMLAGRRCRLPQRGRRMLPIGLRSQPHWSDKALVGNTSYRRHLKLRRALPPVPAGPGSPIRTPAPAIRRSAAALRGHRSSW
jgi:hypothetical protein